MCILWALFYRKLRSDAKHWKELINNAGRSNKDVIKLITDKQTYRMFDVHIDFANIIILLYYKLP